MGQVVQAKGGAVAVKVDETPSQYLTFSLGGEMFAVGILNVKEIIEYGHLTEIPMMPAFIRGVINLRGSVVPVIDLRLKFGMSKTETTINTCIIVLEILLDSELLVLGALADSVQEVFELEPDQIEPAPKLGTRFRAEFLKGMGKRDDNFLMILDIDKVFSAEELLLVQEAGGMDS